MKYFIICLSVALFTFCSNQQKGPEVVTPPSYSEEEMGHLKNPEDFGLVLDETTGFRDYRH